MRNPKSNPGLARRAANALFRHHIENGVSVALCLAAVAVAAGLALGPMQAIVAGTGALCVSIVDQPGRLAGKLPVLLAAVAAATAISLLAELAGGTPWALATVIAAMSAGFALATAYGRPALTVGIAGVLALVLGMAVPVEGASATLRHGALFAAGGTAYALLAFAAAWLFDDRNQRMFLNEALLAFARYLRARARGYSAATSRSTALGGIVEAHGALMERLQAARDTIFTGRPGPANRKRVRCMMALLDAYEAVLSSDADWATMPRKENPEVLRLIAGLTRAMAHDIEGLALSLVVPSRKPSLQDHRAALDLLDITLDTLDAGGRELHTTGLRPTRNKINEAIRRIGRLADALAAEPGTVAELPAGIDLGPFIQVQQTGLATLRAHLTLTSPVMRYAIRLTLAMLAGYALTLALPRYVHGGWILLTVYLIMRANYALTRRRRNDRILGTLVGCAVAAVLIPVLPPAWIPAAVILAAGTAHAYAVVDYRVASFAASVMALLLLHLLQPHEILIADRIVDTLIGAALSAAFSRLLPSWEWRDIPRLVNRLMEADRDFAAAALSLATSDHDYRLARKRALDGFTALATTTRRLSGEPGVRARHMTQLNALLGANYLFASDLASTRTVRDIRAGEIDPAAMGALFEETRPRVLASLKEPGASPAEDAPPADTVHRRGWTEIPAVDAMAFLRRRLRHLELAAGRLAALAGRALAAPRAGTTGENAPPGP